MIHSILGQAEFINYKLGNDNIPNPYTTSLKEGGKEIARVSVNHSRGYYVINLQIHKDKLNTTMHISEEGEDIAYCDRNYGRNFRTVETKTIPHIFLKCITTLFKI
jgi:hypothetical protein